MKDLAHLLTSCLALAFFAGCASTPIKNADTRASGANPRQISLEARVQIQNKIEKKTYTLVLQAAAREPSQMRLDLTGPFAQPIGQLIMNGQQILILAPAQKKAYQGLVSAESFRPLFPLSLNPQDLMQFLLGELPASWVCQKQSESTQHCHNANNTLTLDRDPRPEGSLNKWNIAGDRFAMTILPISIKTNVQLKPEAFALLVPDNYSRHKIP